MISLSLPPEELQKAKEKSQRSGDLKEEAAVCNQLGEILARHGRFQEALEEHRQELRLLESVDDVIGCAVAHRKIGERLAELESYKAALKHQRQHLELARSLSNHIEQQRAWATIGRTYMFIADSSQSGEALREAEQAFMKSLAIVEETLEGEVPRRELSEMKTRLYLNLGLVYDSLKDQAKCSHYIRKSIFISEQNHLHEDLYRAYFNLGNIQLREGEHSKAMRCLEGARECARRMKEKCMESECCAIIPQVRGRGYGFEGGPSACTPALGTAVTRSLPALRVSRLQEALEEAAPSNPRAALGLCEQLGDLFSKAGDYRRAVEAYERQLRFAESLRSPEAELAVIHVSLAATFGDLKEHGRAVQHYRAELALRRGNPLEEGKTWLNVALSKEEAGKGYEELESCFRTALQCAERAQEPRLQRQILRHLHAVQQRGGCPEGPSTLARLRSLCRSQGWSSDGESSGEEEKEELENSEALEEESDLELSESGEWARRRQLLPLAPPAGGGQSLRCSAGLRPPPLAPPAGGGQSLRAGSGEIGALLALSGCILLPQGQSPLDTLQEWLRIYGRELDQETRERCSAMARLLQEAKAGSRPQLPRDSPSSQLFDAELPAPPDPTSEPPLPCRMLEPSSEEESDPCGARLDPEADGMSPLRPVRKRQRLLSPSTLGRAESRTAGLPGREASAQYQAAIRSVGSAHCHHPQSPEPAEPPARPALIPAEHYVGDDWLEDDLVLSRKRSRRGLEESGSESGDTTGPENDGGSGAGPQAPAARRRRRARQSRLTRIVDRAVVGRTESPPPGHGPKTSLLTHLSLPVAPAPPPPIRVRVQVQEKVFLIPVPHGGSESHPVSWLAEQASQRYYQTCGLLPRLTLKKEGALLAPQDLIVDVLQSNEEVIAEVQSWDLPPLAERYRKACQSLAVGEHRLLVKITELQDPGPLFSACGLMLRRLHLTPLLRALKLQTSIRQLRLSGTGLDDSTVGELLATIGTMPSLTLLDLSANQLGTEGLHKLGAGPPGHTAFQSLEELDLSLNPLGDGCSQFLASLLQACPVLSTLRLQGCGFTMAFLQHYRLLLASALRGAVHLKKLILSHNALGPMGLQQLLKSLPCDTLGHLEIGSVAARPGEQQPLVDAVVGYLMQEGCALTHLTLSGNQLSDEAVGELARCLPACLSLDSLDLSANAAVTIVGLRMLLSALRERNRGLHYLSLAGCSVQGPLDSITWARLSLDVRELRLCSRQLSRSDQQQVGELWGSPPLCTVTRHHKLFCKSL
uniref:NF-kappa-B inhibitor-like protein 2 n=1 Tax=Sphenodon punctatus TaxID=8508 RepID=A0A8D0L632_SPHPU